RNREGAEGGAAVTAPGRGEVSNQSTGTPAPSRPPVRGPSARVSPATPGRRRPCLAGRQETAARGRDPVGCPRRLRRGWRGGRRACWGGRGPLASLSSITESATRGAPAGPLRPSGRGSGRPGAGEGHPHGPGVVEVAQGSGRGRYAKGMGRALGGHKSPGAAVR